MGFDAHAKKGKKSLYGVFKSNSFKINDSVLYLQISRFNHSCLPNVAHKFTGSVGRVYALKDIKKGEELFLSYNGTFASLEDRQRQLQNVYKFTCKCEMCQGDSLKFRAIEKARMKFKENDRFSTKFELMKKAELMTP